MPGIYRESPEKLLKTVEKDLKTGLNKIILFGIPATKDPVGTSAYGPDSIIYRAVQRLKKKFGTDLCIVCDLCLCEYTSHGHCGSLTESGDVDNDVTIRILGDAAVSYAEAGADIIAPSDMMDGRVGIIRSMLDEHGFQNRIIMSYTVKYASAFICFPGGFGTMDEFFESMTLIQTGKTEPMKVILIGKPFWDPMAKWIRETMLDKQGAISPEDLDLFSVTDDLDEAVEQICVHHKAVTKAAKAARRMTAEGTVYGVPPRESRKQRRRR